MYSYEKSIEKPIEKFVARSLTFEKVALRLSKNKQAGRVFSLLAETFKALGDSSRVQVIWALSHGELCVGDIATLLGMNPSAVSHHLRTLRNLRLVGVRRQHRTVYYSLDDEHIEHLLDEGLEHVEDLL